MSEPEPSTQTLSLLGDKARRTAVLASFEAVKAVVRGQALEAGFGEEASVGQLVYSEVHSGDTPIRFDAVARKACLKVLRAQLSAFVGEDNELVEVGEEAGVSTRILNAQDLLARLDVLDGSTNAKVTLSAFSSVVLIDQVRTRRDGSLRVHHLAGAITVANGWTVSWVNQGRYDHAIGGYHGAVGDVYVSAEPWDIPEFELVEPSWTRRSNSASAVASKASRLETALKILGDGSTDALFYNVGGTPIVAALLMGQVENVIEPSPVTLHDSAHLIPHQLLRGTVESVEDGAPFDYLALYEEHALNLDPTHKPVPPYWARGPKSA